MKKQTATFLFAALTFAQPTLACVNTYFTRIDGSLVSDLAGGDAPDFATILTSKQTTHWDRELKETEARLASADPEEKWRHEADLAVLNLRFNKVAESVTTLERLTRAQPKEYILAANLGTAYELAGRDEDALVWIKRAMELDPSSHEGTEWLHVKILEAKLASKADPTWWKSNSVLGLDFGNGKKPRRPEANFGNERVEAVEKALLYQLRERLSFVKPPDAIVGDLLFDFANLVALHRTVEAAKPLSELALSFEPPRKELAQERDRHYRWLLMTKLDPDTLMNIALAAIGAVALAILIGTYAVVRRVLRNRRNEEAKQAA